MKFLFIEDDVRFFHWLTEVLPDHECVRVDTLEEIVSRDIAREFDAVFVDLVVPPSKQTDVKLVAAAKALANGRPVIILTGAMMRADLQRIADGFLFKSALVESEHPERAMEGAVANALARYNPVENTIKLFSALGALRTGVPA